MNALSSSSSCGLSGAGRCRSYECSPGLIILRSMIGGCRTNVEWCYIRFNGPEPGVTWSARSAVPVPWRRRHTGPDGSTVVYRWIGTCSVTEERKAGGMDVCKWWLISTSADLLICKRGLQEMHNICRRHDWSNTSRFLASCQVGTMFLFHRE